MIGLGKVGHRQIDASGCLFLVLGDIAENFVGAELPRDDIIFAYDMAVPKFMREDCYLLDHEKVLRIFLSLLGQPWARAKYLYRADSGKKVISEAPLLACNYFVAGVPYPNDPDGRHFYRSDISGAQLWNPGQTVGEIVTMRGYRIG